MIERVIDFLSGDTKTIVRELQQQMRDAAADERFEDAARYRNRLFAIENLAEKQGADRRETGSIDVLGVAAEGDRAAVQVFPLRGGKMIDRHGFHLENVEGQDVTTVLEAFALEYYGNAPSIPPQIVVPPDATGLEALQEFLSELRGSRVEVRTPARGEKRRLAELAGQNARLALDSATLAAEQKQLRRVHALEELREALNLESLPLRIECFDISNIQGQEIVGSMVVFQDGIAKKAHYRKFGVRGLDGQDDFAAMAEVVSRRFARLRTGVGGRVRRGLRDGAEPRRHRRRQGPALGGAGGDAGVRAAARGRDLPRRSGWRRSSSRSSPIRSCSIRTAPVCNCSNVFGTRRTASRSTSTASGARRGRASRSSTRSRASVRRAGVRCCSTSARRRACSRRARRSSRACPRPGEDRALDLRAAPDRQPGR